MNKNEKYIINDTTFIFIRTGNGSGGTKEVRACEDFGRWGDGVGGRYGEGEVGARDKHKVWELHSLVWMEGKAQCG